MGAGETRCCLWLEKMPPDGAEGTATRVAAAATDPLAPRHELLTSWTGFLIILAAGDATTPEAVCGCASELDLRMAACRVSTAVHDVDELYICMCPWHSIT